MLELCSGTLRACRRKVTPSAQLLRVQQFNVECNRSPFRAMLIHVVSEYSPSLLSFTPKYSANAPGCQQRHSFHSHGRRSDRVRRGRGTTQGFSGGPLREPARGPSLFARAAREGPRQRGGGKRHPRKKNVDYGCTKGCRMSDCGCTKGCRMSATNTDLNCM